MWMGIFSLVAFGIALVIVFLVFRKMNLTENSDVYSTNASVASRLAPFPDSERTATGTKHRRAP
jgi:hypothetical protein